MTVKSRLSRRLRKSRKNRGSLAAHFYRSRSLRLEALEDRCLLAGITSAGDMGSGDGGSESNPSSNPEYIEGQLIVQFAAGTTSETRDRILQEENARLMQDFYGIDFVLVELSGAGSNTGLNDDPATGLGTVISQWTSYPEVVDASVNRYLFTPRQIPNDPLFPSLWGLHNNGAVGGVADADIDAPEAWDTFTGTSNTVVAIIDTGVDYLHRDLDDNMWRNPGEIPNDNIDNDGNGYVDDIYGIAPALSATSVDPMDTVGHGTHVAGTVGAEGNNGLGVTGVNWDVQMMAINVLEGPLGGTEASIAAGISYVTMMRLQYGVNVVVSNNSYAGDPGAPASALILAAIDQHTNADILFVVAAANDTNNNDAVPVYPSSYDLDGILSVAATTWSDGIASYSNWGQTSVDIGAPGGDSGPGDPDAIWSTWPSNVPPLGPGQFPGYEGIQGTSMASPHVAGAAALLRGLAPELTALQTKQILMDTVDPIPSMQDRVLSRGRLNIASALESIASSEINGTVWRDDNGNGQQDGGETGISNWTVFVDSNNNGSLDSGEPSAVTDTNGYYAIDSFTAPGTYTVAQVVQSRWDVTYPATGTHTITIVNRGDTITGINFGNKPKPGSISGFKWFDMNGDGVLDPGEPGRGGVWIYADVDNNGRIGLLEPAAVTAADGSYAIYDIPAGEIAIREVLPLGWTTSYPAAGHHIINIIPATTITNVDFGNFILFDFGDAPSNYPTTAAAGGAYHGITTGYQLGALIDAELDGQPTANADGDDTTNLADEDGVNLNGTFFQGSSKTIQVTIQSSDNSDGYLQGWIDYNADGDWSDPGEQIIQNLTLGTGTHDVTFTVASGAGVVVGDSFARFRYGPERDLGSTGKSLAGEVEDYIVTIQKDDPVAVENEYEVVQDSDATTLNVLDNDIRSSTGVLNIVEVTQPANGVVTIAADRQSLTYKPNFGTFSPPNEVFRYTIDDGRGKTSSAQVTVVVRAAFDAPMAVDDIFRVATGSAGNVLTVLPNDLPGSLGTVEIASVTTPGSGTAVINNNGTPGNPMDDYIVYTPNASFARGDQFEYTISNSKGSSTAQVTILEDPAPADLGLGFFVEFRNAANNPITGPINVGDQFSMVVSVQDTRSTITAAARGVFSPFLDVLYDRTVVQPVADATNPAGIDITYSTNYPPRTGAEGDAATPGLLNEMGSFGGSLTPLGPDKVEMFRVTFTAGAAGVATFATDPFDEVVIDNPGGLPIIREINYITYLTPPPHESVPYTDINFSAATLTINPAAGSGEGESLDVNLDGFVSTVDALLVIRHLNSTPAFTTSSLSPASTRTFDGRLDVNHDSFVSTVDALLIIARLNGRQAEGEGSAIVRTSSVAAPLESAPLLATTSAIVLPTSLSQLSEGQLVETAPEQTALDPTPTSTVTQDWQLQIGQPIEESTPIDPADATMEPWESLLDSLAEDVLEVALNGEGD